VCASLVSHRKGKVKIVSESRVLRRNFVLKGEENDEETSMIIMHYVVHHCYQGDEIKKSWA
jgi:hypothetical protein